MKQFFVAFVFAVLVGCFVTPISISTHPRVVLDGALTLDERDGVEEGLAAWEKAVPAFHFRISSMEHTEIIDAALSHSWADTIFIVRNEGTRDHDCPLPIRQIGDANAAIEGTRLDQAIICIDATFTNYVNEWKGITMHEVGHALHLEHRPPPSVMAVPSNAIADEPTAGDIEAVKRIWGLP